MRVQSKFGGVYFVQTACKSANKFYINQKDSSDRKEEAINAMCELASASEGRSPAIFKTTRWMTQDR
jgi:hypothetical protein